MRCFLCDKELCERGYCHNAQCHAYDDDVWCDCDGEDEWEDPLENLCEGCGSELCMCGECHTPACELEGFACEVKINEY